MLHMCRVVVGECDGRPFAPSVQRKILKKKEGQCFYFFARDDGMLLVYCRCLSFFFFAFTLLLEFESVKVNVE